LKLRSTVLRTTPVTGLPEAAVAGKGFAFRKRLDGGYSIARGMTSHVEIVPDSFRLFFNFLPALKAEWHSLRLHVNARFMEEWRRPSHWRLDEPSPFEQVRVLDPAPIESDLAAARDSLAAAFPAFAGAAVAQEWAGMIDATPDAVPVISPVDSVPGFFIATGFSGHGFGIGPGAGRLMADLVMGSTPVVDPSDFRLSRFTDGSRPRPLAGF
jgi:glycine/D-amino acid oxidase-like deaminating enzyme